MKSSPDPFYVYILADEGVKGGTRAFDRVSHNTPTLGSGDSHVKYVRVKQPEKSA